MPPTKGKPRPKGTGAVRKATAVKKTAVGPKAPARPKKSPTPKRTPAKPQRRAQAQPASVPVPHPPAPANYEAYKDRQAAISRGRSAKGREIGGIPDIADPERRERCSKSLKLHCETYHPESFYLGWSDDHLRAIDRIEEAAKLGALFALAMDRGKGKTTLCRAAAEWALLNAIRRYAFMIGATDAKAVEALEALKIWIRFSENLAADYPEVSWPARCLAGIANRASGQTCRGESTLIDWSSDSVVFPTVPPPENWPKHWPLRSDGMVPTSGSVLATSGLTGEGIRGSLKALTTGEMVRPDFVLLDDPQTPQSARSKTQNEVREQLVSADVLGMAGPGQSIAAVMPCTVIEPGDMVDRILDRGKHPLWRGERSGILKSMPAHLDRWDAYFEVYSRCAQLEPPDFTESNDYYRAHRVELEEGAEASWPERKLPEEVSAVQHAMHLYFRDPFAFWAEYMNRPRPLHAVSAGVLDGEALAARGTNLPRLKVPRSATRLTAMIDVGAHLLWFCVTGWDERFGGQVVDYGTYPEQARSYFSKSEPRPGLGDLTEMRGLSQEAVIYAGLTAIAGRLFGRVYQQEETGTELRLELSLVDANWGPGTDLVYDFCRRSTYAPALLPSHGKFVGVSARPMSSWERRDGETPSPPGVPPWRISSTTAGKRGRHVTFDTNRWKSFVAERLRTAPGAAGALALFAGEHRMFADHCTAEYPVAVCRQAGGATVDEWKNRPGRDNDWWDCLIGSAVAASVRGLRWDAGVAAGAPPQPPREKKKYRLSDKFYEKNGGRR